MMPDREKVIKGLKCCHKYGFHEDCPYDKKDPYGNQNTTCMMDLMADALALLREQEAKIRQLRLALDIAKGTCNGIKVEGR